MKLAILTFECNSSAGGLPLDGKYFSFRNIRVFRLRGAAEIWGMKKISNPSILYFGTPVVLIGTTNADGSYNLAPISSIFWLGWRAVIGISAYSQTTLNLLREGECTLSLPGVDLVDAVNRLAKTTGSNPVPEGKRQKGYRFEPRKFELAGLTPRMGELVSAPLVGECPVQMETKLMVADSLARENALMQGRILKIELKVMRVHLDESIIMDGHPDRVDPDKWRPLIMSFQEFYGLGEKVHPSTLGTIPERLYRTPDIEEASQRAAISRQAAEIAD
jgi:flavin reductase (DIM6/NTAB) family NADH-FMN oxidoreductase RutF